MTFEENLATLRKLTGYLYSEHMSTEANESHEVIDQVETYVERLEKDLEVVDVMAGGPKQLLALETEIARLREQNDGLYEAVKLSKHEQDRLREALREIAENSPGCTCVRIARTALGEKTNG